MVLEIFSTQTKTSTLDNLMREKNMGKEIISSVKEQFSVENGKMIKKYKANWLYLMVMSLTDVSSTISDTKVNIGTEMEIFMKEHGRAMWKKDLVNCF